MGMEVAVDDGGFNEMMDGYFSDSEVVSHVREVLKLATQGDVEQYNELIEVVGYNEHLEEEQEALLVSSLRALSGAVSSIDIVYHEALLSSLFRMSVWNYRKDAMDALMQLIVSLAASSGKFVDDCLDMLVCNFLPPQHMLVFVTQPRGLSRKEQVLDRVHSALQDISDLVPLAPLRLLPIIVQRMPRIHAKEALIVMYVESMLRLESSVLGELVGSTMLMAVVDRLIDLDVEIGWEDILQEDSSKGMFDMELEDLEKDAEDDDIVDKELPKGTLSRQSLGSNVFADKLDSLMVLTCEHLKFCMENGRLVKVFETLIQSFQITVLNAYKSKFAQFVMFYACSLDPENCGVKFADLLADIFVCHTHPLFIRMSAVAYLASYLSRGRFLSSSFVGSVLKRLVDWCFEYIQSRDGEEKTMNPATHRIFYSACQALMYVLCFRMRSMMDVPHLKSELFQMPLEPILCHSLDPLKVCLPTIVDEFLRQAKAARLFTTAETFIFNDFLESEFSRAFGGLERLDMFFPFDPCLLKKSDRYIRPNYVFWSMVKTTYDDDDEDYNSEEDADDEGVTFEKNSTIYEANGMAQSFEEGDLGLDEFEYSMNKMSITPKSSLKYAMGNVSGTLRRMPARIKPSTSPW